MILWHNGHYLEELFNEAKAIQQQLQSKQRSHDIAIISKQFKILMQKGTLISRLFRNVAEKCFSAKVPKVLIFGLLIRTGTINDFSC